jgi:DNA-binding response OmpR family regulator
MPHILIIDDDARMRDVLFEMMDLEGYTASVADNGLTAQKLLESHTFDCVITDIVMPEKEGLETILYLRKNWPGTPIIAISGGARIKPESYLDMALQFGARFAFAKPFVHGELVAAVKKCLET